ncbi:MAG: PAS domain S-box protein, partial [Nostocales cyanobacterium]
MTDTSANLITRTFAKVQLKTLLIVPFVLQTVGMVTLVGYFSYLSSQESVEKLADQLMTEVGDRIEQHLDSYLGKAQEINRTNVDAFESGILDLNDFNALGKYFYRQVQSFNFTYVNFGSKEGGFIGAGYGLGNKLEIGEIPVSDQSKSRSYSVDDQGNRLKLAATLKNPQYSNAAWYLDAVKAGRPIWSSIYTWADLPDRISISASTPVYNTQKNLLGVLGIDLELSQISRFLKRLNSRRSGHIFIIERSGLIVASSGDESPAPIINGKATPLKALNSREPVIRDVTQHLMQEFGSLQAISQPQSFRPALEQKPFVRVTPYRDDYGLDWLVVTVIPESEFMRKIHANAHRTLIICALALVIAIGMGSFTAYWIAKPILRLSRASQAMAKGEWQDSLSEDIAIAELKVLATSFNLMSAQVKKTFQESEEKFAKIFRTSPDLISIVSITDGIHLVVNDQFFALTGYTHEEVIGHTVDELNLMVHSLQAKEIYNLLQTQQRIRNYEMELRTKSGEIKIGLLSSELIELDCQIFILSVFKDISQRQQIELALKASELRLRSILDYAPAFISGVRLYSLDNWEYEYFSLGIEAISGYTGEEIAANPSLFSSLILPEDQETVVRPILSNLFTENFFTTIEYRIRHKNGSLRWIANTINIRWDETTSSYYATGVILDITKRKYAEIALRESETKFSIIFNTTPDPVWIATLATGRLLNVNESFCQFWGDTQNWQKLSLTFNNLPVANVAIQTG